jgi:hypothetical protein
VIQLSDWACDLLMSRGALVESDGSGALRALLPPEVSTKLATSDWLSLSFGAAAGADDAGEWLERLGSLLPPAPVITGARLRQRIPVGRIETNAVLSREFVIQNGVCRLVEDYAETALYCLFSFQYTIESDERTAGYTSVCLNAVSRGIADQPERLLRAIHGDIEEDPALAQPADRWRALFPLAAALAQAEVSGRIAPIEQTANRRLARDSERMDAYYSGLVAQLERRAARRDAEKERGRIEATQLDRAAKLEDLLRKYSLRVQIELADLLAVQLPVRTISARLIRKKEERTMALHWNAALQALDTPLCEHCSGRARPVYLCEKVHVLCGTCWGACPACGKVFCRKCQARCKCGASPAAS